MRRLMQPGPVASERVVCVPARAVPLTVTLRAGLALNEAVTAPLAAAGFHAGSVRLDGVRLRPCAYVIPNPAPDETHVAYFSPTRHVVGTAAISQGQATVGTRDGAPFIHAHAAWRDEAGALRGGHILPGDAIVADDKTVAAWGCAGASVAVLPDAETNFSVFQPLSSQHHGTGGERCVLVRVRPNEDFVRALEDSCVSQGWTSTRLVGCVGSLIGASFRDGRELPDIATEILAADATITPGSTSLAITAVDMRGGVHSGEIGYGNAVCITAECLLVGPA